MTTRTWGAIALIIVVALGTTWALWPKAPAPGVPGPAWSFVYGENADYGNSGIRAIYCVKKDTVQDSDPETWTSANYYDRVTYTEYAEGVQLNVPSLTNFYIVVVAIGRGNYIVNKQKENIAVEFEATGIMGPENVSSSTDSAVAPTHDFSWSAATADNIRVSAWFDANGGAIGDPFYLTGGQEFGWTAKVWLWF